MPQCWLSELAQANLKNTVHQARVRWFASAAYSVVAAAQSQLQLPEVQATAEVIPRSNEPQMQALLVEFDNDEDPDATVIRVSGQDKSDLLMALTGAFNSLDLRVCSASISSTDDGAVMDVFHVTDMQDKKVCWGCLAIKLTHHTCGHRATAATAQPGCHDFGGEPGRELRTSQPGCKMGECIGAGTESMLLVLAGAGNHVGDRTEPDQGCSHSHLTNRTCADLVWMTSHV